MQIVVIAEGSVQNEFIDRPVPAGVQVQFVTTIQEAHREADAFFYLLDEDTITANKKAIEALGSIVFINAMTITMKELPANCVRMNAWPGFLVGKALEIAADEDKRQKAEHILSQLGWTFHFVPDIPGFIAPRTIAMIVNEAYFALGEDVSSKQDIDTAMKLGTGYPFGPFEWSEKIGLGRIHQLLTILTASDARYTPAPMLQKEIQ